MAYRAAGKTDMGLIRKENQDNCLVLAARKLYVIADGMGGHAGGRQASAITVETLRRELDNEEALNEASIEKALAMVNAGILEAAVCNRWEGMGTTLVLAFFAEGQWKVAHIGDSRAYVINEREIYALTRDHSLVGELLANGSITLEEAKVHPHRNVLTRALGVSGDPKPEWNYTAADNGSFLLLCSDGLYNMVDKEAIQGIVVAPDLSLEEKTGRLVEEANRLGGLDNTTVILIHEEGGL